MELSTNPAVRDTIAAISTPPGQGALGVIRMSGPRAIELADRHFRGAALAQQPANTLHVGTFRGAAGERIDQVVVSLFRAPHSYTREDVAEISCHGSPYILGRVQETLIRAGARPANPGEFTLRAFLNGAIDLPQAEAVADLIASRSAAGHKLAMQQLRGSISRDLSRLREELVNFGAMVELELDFGEEDVEFADLDALKQTVVRTRTEISRLLSSFSAGNALKQGIPTVIAGRPNAGKSTLLNRLLNDERAIVTEIPGTTRDVIEERLMIEGYEFRLIDTAGLRETADPIEAEGVRRSRSSLGLAAIILYLFDAAAYGPTELEQELTALQRGPDTELVLVANKADLLPAGTELPEEVIPLSAQYDDVLTPLTDRLLAHAARLDSSESQLTAHRHYDALHRADEALASLEGALAQGRSGELLAVDLNTALQHIGDITGEVTSDEVLGTIFSKFCIGK